MKYLNDYFFCSPRLLQNITEVDEIYACIEKIEWTKSFSIIRGDNTTEHQTAYNKAFEAEFEKFAWKPQPKLCEEPRLIGDFMKNDVFVEIQFGNSATLYRDYYKFHYGLMKRLLSLAVLIVPTNPNEFFPSRGSSVGNMAEFKLAQRYFSILPIPVPILLIGLLPEN